MNSLNRRDLLCYLTAKVLGCSWNDFEVEYFSPNSLMIRLDSDGIEYLVEFNNDIVVGVYS